MTLAMSFCMSVQETVSSVMLAFGSAIATCAGWLVCSNFVFFGVRSVSVACCKVAARWLRIIVTDGNPSGERVLGVSEACPWRVASEVAANRLQGGCEVAADHRDLRKSKRRACPRCVRSVSEACCKVAARWLRAGCKVAARWLRILVTDGHPSGECVRGVTEACPWRVARWL